MAIVAVFVTLLGAGYSIAQTKQYSSSASLFISTNINDANITAIDSAGQYAVVAVQSYAGLVTSEDLAHTVVSELGLSLTPTELSHHIVASVTPNTVNLTITVTYPNAREAQLIAQRYAVALTALVAKIETPPGSQNAPIKAFIINNATLPTSPTSPKVKRNIVLGLVFGLLLGFGQAVLRQKLDTRIRSAEDLSAVTDKPLLGSIGFEPGVGRTPPLITAIPSHSTRAEAFRLLRTNLQFVDVDNDHKVFVLTSAVPEDGKTSTAVNLALSLAQAGVRTVLVEGDLRRPRAAAQLGRRTGLGVTSVLAGQASLADALQVDDKTGLVFLASGPLPPNPAELLQSLAMDQLLNQLRSEFDVVLIDSPPVLPVTDAALLAASADGAIVIIRSGRTRRNQLRLVIQRLEQVDARLLGVVMAMVPAREQEYGYAYGYGYGYGATNRENGVDSVRVASRLPSRKRASNVQDRKLVQPLEPAVPLSPHNSNGVNGAEAVVSTNGTHSTYRKRSGGLQAVLRRAIATSVSGSQAPRAEEPEPSKHPSVPDPSAGREFN